MGWDNTCALVSVSALPQNTHGLGTYASLLDGARVSVSLICTATRNRMLDPGAIHQAS